MTSPTDHDAAGPSAWEVAEGMLVRARQAGDARREAGALTELGVLSLNGQDAVQAAELLEAAAKLFERCGDRTELGDAVGHWGLALLAAGDVDRAVACFQHELLLARDGSDSYAEKTALDHLGLAFTRQRQPARALPYYRAALGLALQTGDHRHEADLRWLVGIQLTELGDEAGGLAALRAAVDLMHKLGKPVADWFADHLRQFQQTALAVPMPAPGVAALPQDLGRKPPPESASLLRRAYSVVKAAAHFVGSGLKTTAPATRDRRRAICASCPHHTGLRCRLCGCFTQVKTSLPHERCPLGSWPAEGD